MSSMNVYEYQGAPTQPMMFEAARAIDGMRASVSKSRSPVAPHILSLAESTLTPVGQELVQKQVRPYAGSDERQGSRLSRQHPCRQVPYDGRGYEVTRRKRCTDESRSGRRHSDQLQPDHRRSVLGLCVLGCAHGAWHCSAFQLYLYQALNKTAAYQVVDYWAYADATGGPLPAGAFADYSSVSQGALSTSAGQYQLKSITLKMALNGRAITTALAAQNSFVNIEEQENTNAALTVLESVNWANYWGNPTIYPNMYTGMAYSIPAENQFDFQDFSTSNSSKGWSNEQTLFNMVYETAGQVTKFRTYGQITHAFMSPGAISDLQGLVTTQLNNVVNDLTRFQSGLQGIIINGDLQGMKTRFGDIQFPIDIFITARDKPAQSIVYGETNTSPATTVNPTPAASVAVTVLAPGATGTTGSAWNTAYSASSGIYTYAVASTDASMNESVLTYSAPVSGIVAGGAYSVAVTPPGANDMTAFRVFRSGLGYNAATPAASAFRYIGDVVGNGTAVVTFIDLNTHIPGSDTIFLLDMDDDDDASTLGTCCH